MLKLNTIHCGDSMDVMGDIDSDSVDCIVTDSPYRLSTPNIKNVKKITVR
jgi:DNA modification methylase